MPTSSAASSRAPDSVQPEPGTRPSSPAKDLPNKVTHGVLSLNIGSSDQANDKDAREELLRGMARNADQTPESHSHGSSKGHKRDQDEVMEELIKMESAPQPSKKRRKAMRSQPEVVNEVAARASGNSSSSAPITEEDPNESPSLTK